MAALSLEEEPDSIVAAPAGELDNIAAEPAAGHIAVAPEAGHTAVAAPAAGHNAVAAPAEARPAAPVELRQLLRSLYKTLDLRRAVRHSIYKKMPYRSPSISRNYSIISVINARAIPAVSFIILSSDGAFTCISTV